MEFKGLMNFMVQIRKWEITFKFWMLPETLNPKFTGNFSVKPKLDK